MFLRLERVIQSLCFEALIFTYLDNFSCLESVIIENNPNFLLSAYESIHKEKGHYQALSISRRNRPRPLDTLPPCARGQIDVIIDRSRREGPFCTRAGRQRRLTKTLTDRSFEGNEIDLVYSTAQKGNGSFDFSFKFQESFQFEIQLE